MRMSLALLLVLFGTTGCYYDSSADSSDNQTTATQQKYYAQKIPVPQLKNSIQRQMMVYWYEMQDNPDLVMYTTVTSHTGQVLTQLVTRGPCIPADTQITNPQRVDQTYSAPVTLPQPEPNGLFMGNGSNGTLCFTTDGNVIYTEGIVTSSLKPVRISVDPAIDIPTTGKLTKNLPVFQPKTIKNEP